jgi:hypothetical protein
MTAAIDFGRAVQLAARLDRSVFEFNPLERSNFLSGFQGRRKSSVVTLIAKTTPNLHKRDNPFYIDGEMNVYKLARVNGVINWVYEKAVNDQRRRENKTPDFRAFPRIWGTRLRGLPFVIHTNKAGDTHHYLEVKIENPIEERYYTARRNVRIPYENIDKYLVKPGLDRQEVESPIILRDYRLDHILAIKIDGAGYVLVG